MKKNNCLKIFVLTAVAVIASSCTNTGGTKPADVYSDDITDAMLGNDVGEVTFGAAGGETEYALWNSIKRGFEEANPGCTMKIVTIAGDANTYANTIYSRITANTAPDVVQVEIFNMGKWARAGAIKGLGRFVDFEDPTKDPDFKISDYYDCLVDEFTYSRQTKIRGSDPSNVGRELYCVPKDIGISGIYVNENLFNRYGIPLPSQTEAMTWDEFFALAKTLNDKDKSTGANHVYGCSPIDFETYAYSLGTTILKDGNKYLNADDPLLIQAMQTAADIQRSDSPMYCAPSLSDLQSSEGDLQMFLGGKTCMYTGGRWYVPNIDKATFNYRVIPYPVKEKGMKTYVPAASMGYGISRCCKNCKVAWKLLKYLSSLDGYKQLAANNYGISGLKTLQTHEYWTNPKVLCPSTKLSEASAKVFLDQSNYTVVPYRGILTSYNWVQIFDQKARELWSGQSKDARAVLKGMETQVNKAIRTYEPQLFQ